MDEIMVSEALAKKLTKLADNVPEAVPLEKEAAETLDEVHTLNFLKFFVGRT